MTELDVLRKVAAAAGRLLELLDLDATRGRVDLDRFHPAEVAALREALGELELLDQAEAELDRIRAKWGET